MTQTDDRPLRLETALAALPDLPDIHLFTEAMIDVSRIDDAEAWGGGARLSTLHKRLVGLSDLELRLPEIAERVRERTERVMERVVGALRAVEARDEAAACGHLVGAGEIEEMYGRPAEAERFYEKALELGRRPRDRRGEALALRRLARVARAGGRLDRATGLYRDSREVAEAIGDRDGLVIGWLGTGHVLADRGRWSEARDAYLQGIASVGDAEGPELVHLCNALSVVERRLGALVRSREWLERGETAMRGVADAEAAAHLQHGWGKLHLAAGDARAAESAFLKALELPITAATRTITLLNLAESVREAGRLEDAEARAREAERLAITHGDLVNLPHVYLELGEIAGQRGDRDGFVFFEQALGVLRERGEPPLSTAAAHRGYGMFDARLGDREAARARLAIAEQLYRAIGSTADAEAVSREIEAISDASPRTSEEDVQE